MKKFGCLILLMLLCSIGSAHQKAKAFLLFVNRTNWVLDVYIDNDYGCTAFPDTICTAGVDPGFHIFSTENGESSVSEGFDFKERSVFKWTIYEKDETPSI